MCTIEIRVQVNNRDVRSIKDINDKSEFKSIIGMLEV